MTMTSMPGSSPGFFASKRAPRSKSGCLTCRRRKVRCNEQKPRCSHCERLNLQCTWRSIANAAQTPRPAPTAVSLNPHGSDGGISTGTPPTVSNTANFQDSRFASVDGSFNDLFNYASFMWDPKMQNDMIPPTRWRDTEFPDLTRFGQRQVIDDVRTMKSSSFSPTTTQPFYPDQSLARGDIISSFTNPEFSNTEFSRSTIFSEGSDPVDSSEESLLTNYFIRTVVPPIIAQVETQLKWSSMRQLLVGMSGSSIMVRYAILAFSEVLMARERGTQSQKFQEYYDKAQTEVALQRNGFSPPDSVSNSALEYILATLFFLSYIDLLEGRIVNAHANLKEAYDVFQEVDKSQLRMVSRRFISWIRLLDARAVSAGGEGLFLLENDDDLLSQSSPASTNVGAENSGGVTMEAGEVDIEDVLFDALYQPGFLFFQRIQSFMGRISKIDPWHRSRGTVEDETEVINIAAKISKDIRSLWDTRPQLMDYALNNKLTSAHISPSLVFTITRTFRTYYASYHASKIHLHRVAYKHLPLTAETLESINKIRETARVMVDGAAEGEEMLPVNMLWPLLMWGTEENDLESRAWIMVQINGMGKVATNAGITAQVLEEVQKRQDSLKHRVDVRTVMHDIFNSCFAIV